MRTCWQVLQLKAAMLVPNGSHHLDLSSRMLEAMRFSLHWKRKKSRGKEDVELAEFLRWSCFLIITYGEKRFLCHDSPESHANYSFPVSHWDHRETGSLKHGSRSVIGGLNTIQFILNNYIIALLLHSICLLLFQKWDWDIIITLLK